MMPTYLLVSTLLVMVVTAYLLARNSVLPLAAGLTIVFVFGENGRVAALLLTWLSAFVIGLLDAIGAQD